MKQLGLRLLRLMLRRRKPKRDALLVLPQEGENIDEILEKAVRERIRRENSDKPHSSSKSFLVFLKDELKIWWSGERWVGDDNDDVNFKFLAKPAFIGNKLLVLFWSLLIYAGFDVGFLSPDGWKAVLVGGICSIFTPGIYIFVKYLEFSGFEKKVRVEKARLAPQGKKECIAELYRNLVNDYSFEIIGNNSPINTVLIKIEVLIREANQSLTYWTKYLKNSTEIDDEEKAYLEERVNLAGQLVSKFEGMRSKLAPQKEALRVFFEEILGQIPVVESTVAHYFENRRLQRLAEEAEIIKPKAEFVAFNVFCRFREDLMLLQNISTRLNGANAEDLPIDQLEPFAEKVFRIGERVEERTKLLEDQVSSAVA